MVQLMKTDTNCLNKVKLELQDTREDEFGPLQKKSKLVSSPEWTSSADSLPTPPSLYNPPDEPSPLGLRLRKSPSLLDLIQMKLSQEDNSGLAMVNNKDQKCTKALGATDTKLKASNFPASILRIGTWEYKSRYEGDLVAKFYFAKHKLVWEVLDGCLKNKIEIPWSDITALKANYPDDGPGTLEVVLARRPSFFREINPQPRKHTLWQATSDFTGGQASIQRLHFLQCSQGLLGKHFEKLIQCDPRINFLSQQPEVVLDSPYFEPRTAIDEQSKCSHGIDKKSEEHSDLFGLQHMESESAVQSSSSQNGKNLMGMTIENISQEMNSRSPVMDIHGIEEFTNRGANTSRFFSNLDQIKVPGLHPSMAMNNLVSHIGHCISEQMASGYPTFAGYNQDSESILEEITQYLFNDSQITAASNEWFLMSRVKSLCCLLQKDPSGSQETKIETEHVLDEDSGGKVCESNSTLFSTCKINTVDPGVQQDDASGSKQENGIPRKESISDLLLNLPRIASLPQFLFQMSEDSGNQVRL